ncbi:hypothetical protein IQ250_08480 [Pseudanabaenaceae cyanobacterium LEGE 13415]|nr:hypothetical protein [Pseudanabaenaceae cyanobacterium LEGE 13415]
MYPGLRSIKSLTLSIVMFGAGAIAATITVSNLRSVNASSLVAQQLNRRSNIVEDNDLRFELQGC